MPENDLPTFPDIVPSRLRESEFHVIEMGDIQTERDLEGLTMRMLEHPERDFYYFQEKGGPSNLLLDRAKAEGSILMEEVRFFFYRHPEYPRNYVHIEVREGRYEWDWQKEVVEKGPMFMRIKLKLTIQKVRDLEIQQSIKAQREREEIFELKPGIYGFSLNLRSIARRIASWVEKLRRKK